MGHRLVFFGTPFFSATILEELCQKKLNLVAVVTRPDKPSGRHLKLAIPPVKEVAHRHNIPIYQPVKAGSPEFLPILRELKPDLFVVAAYSEIFKPDFLQIPKIGCINVHPSLLPKYRGAAPIERAIMAGEKESGVTIMVMNPLIDAGDILASAKVAIGNEMTGGELTAQLAHAGAHLLLKVLGDYESGSVKPSEQNSTLATPAPKISSEDELIDWRKSAAQLHNQIRALSPRPGTHARVSIRGKEKRLRILKSRVAPLLSGKPGEILKDKGLTVAASGGALHLLEVQLEGKRPLNGEDFLRGILKEELTFLLPDIGS